MAVIHFPVFPSFHNAQFICYGASCIQKGKGEFHVKKNPNPKMKNTIMF